MRLFPSEYAATRAKAAKVNERAQRRGFTGRVDVTGDRVVVTNSGNPAPFPNLPLNAEVVLYETTISGEAPRYEGWEFLAALDSLATTDDGAEWIVRCAPGVTDEAVDRTLLRPGACDHCNTQRPNRRKLYLVRRPGTGELRQVGATCIKDFLGWSVTPVFVSTDELLDDEQTGTRQGPPAYTPRYIVAVAIAAVEAFGWVPRSRAMNDPRAIATAERMTPFLVGPASGRAGDADREVIARIESHMPAAESRVDEVISTVLDDFADATHGYQANLRAALVAEQIEIGQLGLTASTVAAYNRIISDQTQQAEKPATSEPEYLGAVGDKVEFTGTITTALTVDGYAPNTTQNLIVITTETALVKFYSSAAWTYDVDVKDVVTVAATIKKLDVWNDKKQTVVVRPKLIHTSTQGDQTQ